LALFDRLIAGHALAHIDGEKIIMTSIKANDALARALTNDRAGKVSEADAKKIVEAAVSEIVAAADPVAIFENNQRFIDAARLLRGGDKDVPVVLDGYRERGLSAVNLRLSQLSGGPVLPLEAERAFEQMVNDYELATPGDVTVSNVSGSNAQGFTFTWKAVDGTTGQARALLVEGNWFFTDKPITRVDLDRAQVHFLAYFDAEIAPELENDWGLDPAEIANIRKEVRPRRAYFDGEMSDPHGLTSTFPFVISFENPTGSDHGYFLGFNPTTDETEAYTYN
jgi:hypothetical protein